MSTASPLHQQLEYSIARGDRSSGVYQVNLQAALKSCKQAQACLQENDLDSCERLAVDALKSRPACHLAYQILGLLCEKLGLADDSVVCRNRRLPAWLHQKYFAEQKFPGDALLSLDSGERVMVFESERLSVPEPFGLFDEPALPFRRKEITSSSVFIDTLLNATIWHDSSNTLVLDSQGMQLADHSVGNSQLIGALAQSSEPVALSGRVILLGARGAHNYYHWLLDIIPKLNALAAAGIDIKDDDTFVVPHVKPAFAQALLARFGIMSKQIFQTELLSPFLIAEQLLVPRLSNTMGFSMGSWIPKALQRSMLEQSPSNIQSSLKIFIGRDENTAAGRTVGNQQEVEAFFSHCGFEIVFPERISVVQQAKLFARASVVAGPHGAGLSNLVYCAPETKVFEFFGAHMAPCYWVISALAELEYYQHYDDADGRQSTTVNPRAAAFDLSVQSAEALLQQASVI